MARPYREDPGAAREIERLSGKTLDEILESSATDARRYVPVLTGDLRNSIGTHKLSPTHGQVFANEEYAAAVEHGSTHRSGQHIPAQPYLRPAVYKNWRGA